MINASQLSADELLSRQDGGQTERELKLEEEEKEKEGHVASQITKLSVRKLSIYILLALAAAQNDEGLLRMSWASSLIVD
ncbi:hypothetical protein ACLKA6_003545 [Drosophila palustris]